MMFLEICDNIMYVVIYVDIVYLLFIYFSVNSYYTYIKLVLNVQLDET